MNVFDLLAQEPFGSVKAIDITNVLFLVKRLSYLTGER